MVSLRKAGAYSKRYARPYTRVSRKRTKNFIKSTPASKLVKFNMGNIKMFNEGKFDTIVKLISLERVQVRDNALEAARQGITRHIDKQLQNQFYFEVRVHPHHILRENKMLTGAGADRMQTGMTKSFGKTMGRAAMVKAGEEIFTIATSGDKNIKTIRNVMEKVKAKLPCKTKIYVEKISPLQQKTQVQPIPNSV
ncbi:MAG: 50S ribosomal protein L16 [Nanoarchaeota archaeon]